MAQDRKVFVGGVPQDLNQDDLYAIFSEYAGVKKAWLQKCRATDDGNGATNPPQNHRGFGFVIFHDPKTIEEILGGSTSRFIVLRGGAKLEVKRALSSSKMSGVGNRSDGPQDPPPLSWPATAGKGQAPAQQPPLRPGTLQPQQRQALAAFATPQNRSAVGQDSNVLSQLSLMPNSSPTYPNADIRGKNALNSGLPSPGGQQSVGIERSGGLTASDGTPLSTYGMISQQVPSQRLLPQPGLLCPPPPMQSMGQRQNAFSKGSLRDTIIQFYKEHCPDKLSQQDFVDSICSYYKDKQDELDDALRQKYGVGLSATGFQGALQDQRTLVQGGTLGGATPHLNAAPLGTSEQILGGNHPSVTGYGTVSGKGQTSEPMYAGQLGLETNWLGMKGSHQRRPAMPPTAPTATHAQHQWQMLSNAEHIPATVASNATSGLVAPGLELSTYNPSTATNAAIANSRPASHGNVGANGQGLGVKISGALEAVSGSEVGVLLSTNGRGALNYENGLDIVLESDLQHDGANVQGDEGFEMAIEVAEAIVGDLSLPAMQQKEWLDNANWK